MYSYKLIAYRFTEWNTIFNVQNTVFQVLDRLSDFEPSLSYRNKFRNRVRS